MEKKRNCMRKSIGIALAALLVIAAVGIVPAAADPELPGYNQIYVPMANDARFDDYDNDTYFINWTKKDGGLNAIHITDDYSDLYGDVYPSKGTTGTFYITDVGNRSFQDDIILLVAVYNDDSFSIGITASGYNWTPTGTGKAPPYVPAEMVHSQTLSATFNQDNFTDNASSVDILQNWKPGWSSVNIPIFPGDSSLYKMFFVDTHAGIFGNVSDLSELTDNGSVKIEYNIQNLNINSKVVINAYAWNQKTWDWNADTFKYDVPGIRWTNNVNTTKTNANVWRVIVEDK